MMKATGVIRRIDDLGRIVIPKEIRRTLKLREGDPMELFVEEGCVVFKKYPTMTLFLDDAKKYCKELSKALGMQCIITDRDQVVANSSKIEIDVQSILESIITDTIDGRTGLVNFKPKDSPVIVTAVPIAADSEIIGTIIVTQKSSGFDAENFKLLQFAATMIASGV